LAVSPFLSACRPVHIFYPIGSFFPISVFPVPPALRFFFRVPSVFSRRQARFQPLLEHQDFYSAVFPRVFFWLALAISIFLFTCFLREDVAKTEPPPDFHPLCFFLVSAETTASSLSPLSLTPGNFDFFFSFSFFLTVRFFMARPIVFFLHYAPPTLPPFIFLLEACGLLPPPPSSPRM